MLEKQPDVTPFEAACAIVEYMSADERLAMMKLLSASLGGPRLYTDSEVRIIVQGALDERNRRGQVIDAAGKFMGKGH
jgi:hypothetical protein